MKGTYILFFVIVFVACRPVKITEKTSTKTDSTAHVEASINTHTEQKTKAAVDTRENLTVKDTTAEKTTITVFSEPDSTGKQYIESITVKEKNAAHVQQANTSTQANTSNNIKQDTKAKTESDTDLSKKTKSDTTTKVPTPAWQWISALVLCGGAVFGSYKVLKRFNLIN